MLSCFRELDTQGLAPNSIGQASLQVLHWLIHMLRKHYPELHLCADNWKAMKLMIDNYSQWFNYHIKKKTGKRVKVENEETLPDLSDDILSPVAGKRTGDSNEALEAEHMKKRAWIDQPITEPVTGKVVSFFST
jgi:hypothetical protein